VGGPLFASPPLRKALRTMLDLADAADAANAALGAYVGQMTGMGYPVTWAIATIPAFDLVSDTLRSLRGSTLDMFRQPEKLLATIDLMQVPTVALAVQGAKLLGNPRVFIPMHRGAGGFMSDEQFERFYWPTFVALIEALLDEDLVPMPLFEGDYTPRLKYLAELPAGKVAAHFDRIDRKKFKEVCGQTLCFWGNVPSSMLATGTPQQVKNDVKELIDLFGDTGSLILDGVGGFPDEARPENVMALREAVDEYGVY
jgi:uroporphyrinogen-III decarboxylase